MHNVTVFFDSFCQWQKFSNHPETFDKFLEVSARQHHLSTKIIMKNESKRSHSQSLGLETEKLDSNFIKFAALDDDKDLAVEKTTQATPSTLQHATSNLRSKL